VHVLSAGQQDLSERFARQSKHKFKKVKWTPGLGSVPLLAEFVARFVCRTTNYYSVGDHIVIVGRVVEYDKTEVRPLVFHSGKYAFAERRMMADVARREAERVPRSGDRRSSTGAASDSDK
jgi:3-hydroxy-9,10-secoandrosta-1,3,5(10)-triene-9,17-dione monooxygenase reductase component